jgi:hypothetical protein
MNPSEADKGNQEERKDRADIDKTRLVPDDLEIPEGDEEEHKEPDLPPAMPPKVWTVRLGCALPANGFPIFWIARQTSTQAMVTPISHLSDRSLENARAKMPHVHVAEYFRRLAGTKKKLFTVQHEVFHERSLRTWMFRVAYRKGFGSSGVSF